MILDHVRFTPTFLPNEKGTWVLGAINEDDNGYSVHKLLASELRQVLALPEVLEKMAPNAGAFSRLREFAAIAIVHGRPEGDHYTIHRNLVDNVASALTELGFDFTKHKELRKEGDKIVAQDPKPGTVSQLAQRVAELQAIVDKRDDRQWDPIVELFHPDMNTSDIKTAIERLLEVQAVAKCASPDETVLGMTASRCEAALWVGRKTQLEKDEQQPLTDPVAEFWRTRYEDLKLGLENALANKHVTPGFQENAVLLAQVPRDPQRHPTRERAVASAEELWKLLDDIDTLSDSIKPSDQETLQKFYQATMRLVSLRTQYLHSDGHALLWPSHDPPRFPRAPEHAVTRDSDGQVTIRGSFNLAHLRALIKQEASATGAIVHGRVFLDQEQPVPMLLYCPMCHTRHIDEGEFATKVHHTHACQGFVMHEGKRIRCGHVWRPAIVATVGVEALPGFVNTIVKGGMLAEGEAIVGKRARSIASGFEGTIKSYSVSEDAYMLVDTDEPWAWVRLGRHEFTVLE